MTNEEKQALIEHIETDLELWRNVTLKYCHECERDDVLRDIKVNEIALAALTAQPVKQPGTKCIGWVKETIQEHDEKWCDAIRAAGYEVQE